MIRPVIVEDAEGLVVLLRSFTDVLPRFLGEPLEATRARVLEVLATRAEQTLLVTEDKGRITGFIHAHWQPSLLRLGGEGFISALFIHSEYRGQGLGQVLLAHIQAEGEHLGCSRLMLLNMRNRPSYERGFYTKLGWKERPEAANFVYDLKRSVL